jgi:hypothetical protein
MGTETGAIIQFPVSTEAGERLAVHNERTRRARETTSALQKPGYILIAWALCQYGGGAKVISAWYLPENGKRWVYRHEYDAKNMKEMDTFSRSPCLEIYQWLKQKHGGLFKELHICAPLYILLDNKELRAEYLAGNMDDAPVPLERLS